jgi:drug/metabolite transporter (DMT)-like permease
MKSLFLPYAVLFVIGIVGAFITKKVQASELPIWVPIFPSIASGFLWGWIAKRSENLSLMSVLVDVLYTAAFVIGFMILGDRLTPLQIAGFLVSLIGVAMMAA